MLYGVSPFTDSRAQDEDLRAVMTLTTQLIAVNRHRKGDAIGYGGEWVCPEDMPVGVAAIGYGDGYPRHARAGTPVLIGGVRVPLIGRVSMDMITLDLRGRTDSAIGAPVVLWGEGLPVEEIAECAGTISYQLLCGVTPRVAVSVTES
jgi:alanine racemase